MVKRVEAKDIIVIPDLRGLEVNEARNRLNDMELLLSILDYEYHEMPVGKVISQIPAPGREIYKNRVIEIIVSRGSKAILVPTLVGISYHNIDELLKTYELKRGTVTQHYSDTVPAGYIIDTEPKAGASIMAGREIHFIISQGRDPLRVYEPQLDDYFFYDEEAEYVYSHEKTTNTLFLILYMHFITSNNCLYRKR
jgi:serine/threonine-protein kinase